VNITIRASPQPKIEWTIDGAIVGQGRTDGRYSAYEPQYMGNDEYNVTLAIAGLTLEDTTKTYNLRASNELGLTDYQVRISSSSKPPSSSLDVAAIVGIVVAVAVLVLVVLLIVFARATGRWCFGGKLKMHSLLFFWIFHTHIFAYFVGETSSLASQPHQQQQHHHYDHPLPLLSHHQLS